MPKDDNAAAKALQTVEKVKAELTDTDDLIDAARMLKKAVVYAESIETAVQRSITLRRSRFDALARQKLKLLDDLNETTLGRLWTFVTEDMRVPAPRNTNLADILIGEIESRDKQILELEQRIAGLIDEQHKESARHWAGGYQDGLSEAEERLGKQVKALEARIENTRQMEL